MLKHILLPLNQFYYEMAYKYGNAPEEFILLDVLYEDCLYDKTNLLDINCPFVKLDGEPLKVRVPSEDDILGDKLTAYAPNTSGIPYAEIFLKDRKYLIHTPSIPPNLCIFM